jgi:hypothetical protein
VGLGAVAEDAALLGWAAGLYWWERRLVGPARPRFFGGKPKTED